MGRCERHHSLACVAVVQLHRLPIRTRDRRLSGDLAYLVGFDHLANSVNDVQVEPYTLREMVHRARRAACASTAYVCVVDRDFRVGLGSAPPLGFQFGSRSDLSTTSRPLRVPGLSA